MDILTPKGQETLVEEARAVRLWHSRYPTFQYCETPKDTPAAVDAILIKNGMIKGVVETKCRRHMSLEKLEHEYRWEWLVTTEKIEKGRYVAEALQVPFIGFLDLVDDDVLLYHTLWKPDYGWVPDIKTRETRTQYSVNGGSALRENSFIDMSNAKYIKGNNDGQQPTSI
jgi:hypothetical protein